MSVMWKYLCYAVGFLFGSIMLFGGSFILHSMPSLFADKIKANLPIVKGTDAYTRYTASTVPLQVRMYMFNVTNPMEVQKFGAKPQLVQVGPFALTERRRKEVLGFSQDNTTLDYKLFRTYFYNESENTIPLNTIITLPNAPAFSASFSAEERKRDEESYVDFVELVGEHLVNESIYLSQTADEWLFKGVKINFLESLNKEGFINEDQPPDNRFGFYYAKNNTWDEKADGVMTISTGVDGNFSNIGKVMKWNGKSEVLYWRDKNCNTIKGTDGQFFHPFVQKDEKLDIFAPDLCRALTIEFIKTTSIRSIELYRFGISSNFFKPINFNNETKCYCMKRSHEAKQFCKLSGIVDVSSCRKKPIVLSTPHFYNGDPSLRQAVDGLQPSAANHDTFIDIEPMTGSVLAVRRRLQVNVEMTPSEGFKASQVLKERLIHPFVWLDQSIVVPDDIAQKLENKLTKKVRFIRILCYAALITGPIILVATLIFICRDIRSEDKKIRGVKKDTGGDYQKIQVIMKPINSSGNIGGNSSSNQNNNNTKE